jgi:hypothetical protein
MLSLWCSQELDAAFALGMMVGVIGMTFLSTAAICVIGKCWERAGPPRLDHSLPDH